MERGFFFLISLTEHGLLSASPCLFFSPSSYAHASPVSFWLVRTPLLPFHSLPLFLSLSLRPSPLPY